MLPYFVSGCRLFAAAAVCCPLLEAAHIDSCLLFSPCLLVASFVLCPPLLFCLYLFYFMLFVVCYAKLMRDMLIMPLCARRYEHPMAA